MPIKPQSVTTEADLLLGLLRQVKEITLKEAAQRLKIPVPTLEAWATFLEEEGVVSMKYKFTTPYLCYVEEKEKKKVPKAPVETAPPPAKETDSFQEIHRRMQEMQQMLETMNSSAKSGEFSKVPDFYTIIMSNLKALRDFILEKSHWLPLDKKAEFDTQLKSVESGAQSASSLVDEGKFEEAQSAYSELVSLLANVLNSMHSSYDEGKQQQVALAAGSTEISELLEKAYDLMKQGKIEEAKQVYRQLDGIYRRMHADYAEKKRGLEGDLAKLNKDLSTNIDRRNIAKVKQGSKVIEGFLNDSRKAMKKEDLQGAEKSYLAAKQVFNSLPQGFLTQKRHLQEGLIKAYEEIAVVREKVMSARFKAAEISISGLLKKISDQLKSGQVRASVETYNQAKTTFAKMPPGFITEKLALQEKLMSAYNNLVSIYNVSSSNEMGQKMNRIRQLISRMKASIRAGSAEDASRTYSEIKEIYGSLPLGFIKEKTQLQDEILKEYELLVRISGEKLSKDVKLKVEEIKELLEEALSYAKRGDYDVAEEMYSQTVVLYNKLPPGFIQSKAMLRSKMLLLYKDIIMNSDRTAMEELDKAAVAKYHEIMKILVESKHHIAKGHFDLIEPAYKSMVMLFEELPIGFVQKSTKLWEKIKITSDEVKLYKKVQGLPRIVSNSELRAALNEVYKLKNYVARNCIEDAELLKYVEARYSQNLQRLMARKPSPPSVEMQRPAHAPLPHQSTHFPAQPMGPQPLTSPAQEKEMADLHRKIGELQTKARPQVTMPAH
ncbi:hypothetical protein JXB11_01285 [Candidatus Woesearchaeota archaeon]|nr:hypothetical protein [Candidatus Woesearchaeota archaeon]